ncbi:MAG: hypothetical protein M5U26_26545 [Planctomycetota bacterium]|nr:hypothetical protein [Planctomycetota bacterium]
MKYFTKEMWLGWQDKHSAKWFRIANTRRAAYWKQLGRLRHRLSKRAHAFFMNRSFHDGRLLEFRVLQLGDSPWAAREPMLPPHPTRVEMDVVPCRPAHLFRLVYKQVRRIDLSFPSQQPLFHQEGGGFDDWGYDELTPCGREFLAHEVLFASGATLRIEFKFFDYNRQALPEKWKRI